MAMKLLELFRDHWMAAEIAKDCTKLALARGDWSMVRIILAAFRAR